MRLACRRSAAKTPRAGAHAPRSGLGGTQAGEESGTRSEAERENRRSPCASQEVALTRHLSHAPLRPLDTPKGHCALPLQEVEGGLGRGDQEQGADGGGLEGGALHTACLGDERRRAITATATLRPTATPSLLSSTTLARRPTARRPAAAHRPPPSPSRPRPPARSGPGSFQRRPFAGFENSQPPPRPLRIRWRRKVWPVPGHTFGWAVYSFPTRSSVRRRYSFSTRSSVTPRTATDRGRPALRTSRR